MGLRTLHWDDWIELDNDFMKYHDLKAQRITERGSKCSYTAPEAFDGAVELLEELCDYLPQRYPSLFKKTSVGMDNIATGESFNVVERPLKEDPMQMAARVTQDDLAIMFEKPDGQYYLLAGSILLAGFWRLEDKLGMALSEIHTSGDVPQYKEKLEKGMMNFFKRVQPDKAVLRNNYFIQVDDKLAWSESIGSEDSDGIGWFTAEKNKAIHHHFFRSERQSLRRYVYLSHCNPLFSLVSTLETSAAYSSSWQASPLWWRRLHDPHVLPSHHGCVQGGVRARPSGERGA
jgi:alpha-1,2-mannosyltransferase